MELNNHNNTNDTRTSINGKQDSGQMFPVLSQARIKKRAEADRKLPLWLSHPTQFPSINLVDSSIDIDQLADFIDEDLRIYLRKNVLINKLFPVQISVIPNLSRQFKYAYARRSNDICVSSPTGSGKTLAYVIPIVNHLKKNMSHSLRALVVLPTRDLALQVFKTFDNICKATRLRCLLADQDLSELKRHVRRSGCSIDQKKENIYSNLLINRNSDAIGSEYELNFLADIVVTTPGILVDLLQLHKWFSVENLQILVIDEADRLMNYQRHAWLETLERKVFPQTLECPCKSREKLNDSSHCNMIGTHKRPRINYTSICACTVERSWQTKHLHKLLFSATLSSDPQLLMHMNLFQPRLFLATNPTITSTKIRNSLGGDVSSQKHELSFVNTRNELLSNTSIPEQLEEKIFIVEQKEKLFCLWYMLHELGLKKVICFTNSVGTNARLCKFLNEIHDIRAVEFSSNLNHETRKKILVEFSQNKIEVIVSTDLFARGMDVEGVEHVISYDMPTSEVFYVHRIGRTARAGRKGVAITLVDTRQLVFFKKIVQMAHKKPNSMRLSDVVDEMKIPSALKRDASKTALFEKTIENYQDRLKRMNLNRKFIKN